MPTVLIVDDSAIDRNLSGGLLRNVAGLQVAFAKNGQEAWEKILQQPPDLVLTDMIMPEMDGLELVAKVVSEFPLVPVILMTGRGSEETAVRALRAGAASYVPKSALAALLAETVENVLEASREELYEIRLMDCLTCSDTTFRFGNDAAMIGPLINYLHRTIRAVGLCDQATGIRVCVALEEASTTRCSMAIWRLVPACAPPTPTPTRNWSSSASTRRPFVNVRYMCRPDSRRNMVRLSSATKDQASILNRCPIPQTPKTSRRPVAAACC